MSVRNDVSSYHQAAALYFSFLLVNQAAQLNRLPPSTPASPAVVLKDKPAAIRLINWELRSFTCSCAKEVCTAWNVSSKATFNPADGAGKRKPQRYAMGNSVSKKGEALFRPDIPWALFIVKYHCQDFWLSLDKVFKSAAQKLKGRADRQRSEIQLQPAPRCRLAFTSTIY